jgi:hypothetical protein
MSSVLLYTFLIILFIQISSQNNNSIPIISVSLHFDPKDYITRLINSIDHPVDKLLIQVGNSNLSMVKDITDKINLAKKNTKQYITNLEITIQNFNPGSAKGFNFGLSNLLVQPNIPWVFIVNSDISFFPGMLKKIAESTNYEILNNEKFGVGFTSLCCGNILYI